MARLESKAKGGYYPLPPKTLELLKSYLYGDRLTLVDPCAGEGEAIFALKDHFPSSRVYLCELEEGRGQSLKEKTNSPRDKIAVGDFFCLETYGEGGDFLFLNPPYDSDSEYSRLEERFLTRSVDLLRNGGWLCFVVPYYALKASKATLEKHFSYLKCYRFPDSEYEAYKQVILFGQKIKKVTPTALPLIDKWSSNPDSLPVLTEQEIPSIGISTTHTRSFYRWEMGEVDVVETLSHYQGFKGIRGLEVPSTSETFITFPVASKPRAAHLAGAIASGVFDGLEIKPNIPGKYPNLLIKGVFDRVYKTIDTKENKEGVKIGEIQVQQPSLQIHVCRLDTYEYLTLKPVLTEETLEPSFEEFNMRDLLTHYGVSLMEEMAKVCPVIDEMYPDLPLPPLKREPFPAQMRAIQTHLKLHQIDPTENGLVLGEIGSGKTTVAVTMSLALKKKRVLVMCPPHLLTGWIDEIKIMAPEAKIIKLDNVSKAREFALSDAPMTFGILSREKAKLGHKWESVKRSRCPKCGNDLKKKNYALKREKCGHLQFEPLNPYATWLKRYVGLFAPYLKHPSMAVSPNRYIKLNREWKGATPEMRKALEALCEFDGGYLQSIIAWAFPTLGIKLYHKYPKAYNRNRFLLSTQKTFSESPDDADFKYFHTGLWEKRKNLTNVSGFYSYRPTEEGVPTFDGLPVGSLEAIGYLFTRLLDRAKFKKIACGEPLYQASPKPSRVALATWLKRFYPKSYDMLIVDETHEYASQNAAQTKALERLEQTNAYILKLTGSFANGYATSIFMNMRGLSKKFRSEYGRKEQTRFVEQFGYWKQLVSEKDDAGKIVEWGSCSDREKVSARRMGVAPGILPSFILRYILPRAVTLQKEDLKIGIPPRSDFVVPLNPTPEMTDYFSGLQQCLVNAVNSSRFVPELAGKLWGTWARLPFYFDLAHQPTKEGGDTFQINWPDSCGLPDPRIAEVPVFKSDVLLPKEEWLLKTLVKEAEEGRNCLVFTYHRRLLKRFQELVKEKGLKVEVLESSKVPTAKRQDWITKKVVKKKVQVLICNPKTVQTGLNNLVHFSSIIWMENPMCDPQVYRQANGRIDRIGQKLPTRVYFPVYSVGQKEAHQLLLHKVGVGRAVDGLDPEAALKAAGVIDNDDVALSLGKQLYKMLSGPPKPKEPVVHFDW